MRVDCCLANKGLEKSLCPSASWWQPNHGQERLVVLGFAPHQGIKGELWEIIPSSQLYDDVSQASIGDLCDFINEQCTVLYHAYC